MRLSLDPKEKDCVRLFSDSAADLDAAAQLLVKLMSSGGQEALAASASPSPLRAQSRTPSPRQLWAAGSTQRLSAVRWGVAGNIVAAWLLTLPSAGLIAAFAYFLLNWAF